MLYHVCSVTQECPTLCDLARLLHLWDYPGKNIGMGCYFLNLYLYNYYIITLSILVKVKVSVTQSCLTLCDPMNYSLLGFSVHGILQARILKWHSVPFSRGSSWPRDQTYVSCISCPDRRILYYLSHIYNYKGFIIIKPLGFPSGSAVKYPLIMQETQEMWIRSLSQDDLLEEELATHSSTLALKIPRTEEPGGLVSIGLQRVGHDQITEHTHV